MKKCSFPLPCNILEIFSFKNWQLFSLVLFPFDPKINISSPSMYDIVIYLIICAKSTEASLVIVSFEIKAFKWTEFEYEIYFGLCRWSNNHRIMFVAFQFD